MNQNKPKIDLEKINEVLNRIEKLKIPTKLENIGKKRSADSNGRNT